VNAQQGCNERAGKYKYFDQSRSNFLRTIVAFVAG
jgi:hypothetical protein